MEVSMMPVVTLLPVVWTLVMQLRKTIWKWYLENYQGPWENCKTLLGLNRRLFHLPPPYWPPPAQFPNLQALRQVWVIFPSKIFLCTLRSLGTGG
jgi:hypothetical protein